MKLNTKNKILIAAICLPIMFISFCGATMYTIDLFERTEDNYVDVSCACQPKNNSLGRLEYSEYSNIGTSYFEAYAS